MKLTTIFNAYKKAMLYKDAIELHRDRGRFGIAVGVDQDALDWQRIDRQARAFEKRLRSNINGVESEARQ
jgi:hypothetical protein